MRKKRGRELLFKFVLALFILCLFALFVLGIFIRHLLVPRRGFFFSEQFWLGYKALMKAFRANMLIFFFLFPWGSRKAWQCHRGSGQQNWWKTLPAFFFFSPSSFIHIVLPLFSPQLSVSVASLYGSSDFFFKQPFSSVSLFLSATFLASLILTPSFLLAAFLPLLPSMCEALLINKRQTWSYVFVCVCVWETDASSLIALLASPPLLTPLHTQLQAFFPPPTAPPSIQAPSQEGGFGGQVGGQDGGFIVVGARGWGPGIQAKPQTQDPDLACQPAH